MASLSLFYFATELHVQDAVLWAAVFAQPCTATGLHNTRSQTKLLQQVLTGRQSARGAHFENVNVQLRILILVRAGVRMVEI